MITSNELKEAIKNKDLTDISWEDMKTVMAAPEKYYLTFGEMLYVVGVFTGLAKDVNSAVVSTQTDARKIDERLSEMTSRIDSMYYRIDELEKRFERMGLIFSGEDQW